MRTERRKGRLSLALRIILPLLIAVCCVAVPPTVAKYISSANGSATADIAKFDVQVSSGSSASLVIDAASSTPTASYAFTVTNNSDVTVMYDVIVTLPADHTVQTVTVGLGSVTQTIQEGVTEYVFEDVATLAYGGASKTDTLIFTSTSKTTAVNVSNIKVTVVAEQVD